MTARQRVYCGPNILKYGLMRWQVFIGEELPYNLKDAIKEIPELQYLICEVQELEYMRHKISETGSAENVYNSAVKEILKHKKAESKERT